MRIKQILVAFLFTALVISCGNKAKDIDVSELKTECEVVDAMITVADEMLEIMEANDFSEEKFKLAAEEQKKEYKLLKEKKDEIEEVYAEKFSVERIKKCPKFEILMSKMKLINNPKKR